MECKYKLSVKKHLCLIYLARKGLLEFNFFVPSRENGYLLRWFQRPFVRLSNLYTALQRFLHQRWEKYFCGIKFLKNHTCSQLDNKYYKKKYYWFKSHGLILWKYNCGCLMFRINHHGLFARDVKCSLYRSCVRRCFSEWISGRDFVSKARWNILCIYHGWWGTDIGSSSTSGSSWRHRKGTKHQQYLQFRDIRRCVWSYQLNEKESILMRVKKYTSSFMS